MRSLKLTPQEWYQRLQGDEYRSLANANKAIGKTSWGVKVKAAARAIALAFFQKKVPERAHLLALGVGQTSFNTTHNDELLELERLVSFLKNIQSMWAQDLPPNLEHVRLALSEAATNYFEQHPITQAQAAKLSRVS